MRVLIIDKIHPVLAESFEQAGWECDYRTSEDRAELKKLIGSYDGLVLRSRVVIDADFLQAADNLRFVGRVGAGLDIIDLDYCAAHDIEVFRSAEGNMDAVAEHALGMLLTLLHNIGRADTEVRNGLWRREENRGTELQGRTVGIIGYGVMGSSFASKLRGMGVEVLAYDKYRRDFGDEFVQEVSLQVLQQRADIVSLHTPLTSETIGMVDAAFLSNFSKPIYFINTARGKSVVTSDLVAALRSGKVRGACLDVLEYEHASSAYLDTDDSPPALQFLRENPDRVVLTPHIAGWSHEAKLKMARILAQKITGHFQ